MNKNIIINFIIFFIKIYQFLISPLIGSNCRYLPTCSEYTIQALKEHGFFKGIFLSINRIRKCHPFGGNGFDPIPQKKQGNIK
tara:strand:- start:97 stop:345 length:249 start_codon:yes stop_codon:yes gene_type:complete